MAERKMNLAERAEDMRTFFERKTDGYDDVHAAFLGTKRLLADGLPEDTRRVLDLGAGTGLELFAVFERFPEARVTAVDLSESMLAELARRPFADRVRILCADFFDAELGDGYDAVISTSALHHFEREDKERLCRKVLEALRPGGRFLNADKISFDRRAEADAFARYYRWRGTGEFAHIDTPLAPSTEVELLENAGFRRITVGECDRPEYRLFTAIKEDE